MERYRLIRPWPDRCHDAHHCRRGESDEEDTDSNDESEIDELVLK